MCFSLRLKFDSCAEHLRFVAAYTTLLHRSCFSDSAEDTLVSFSTFGSVLSVYHAFFGYFLVITRSRCLLIPHRHFVTYRQPSKYTPLMPHLERSLSLFGLRVISC
jgi:hypothetical protein